MMRNVQPTAKPQACRQPLPSFPLAPGPWSPVPVFVHHPRWDSAARRGRGRGVEKRRAADDGRRHPGRRAGHARRACRNWPTSTHWPACWNRWAWPSPGPRTVDRRTLAGPKMDSPHAADRDGRPRPVHAPWRLVRRLRASFCVLGPLLARRGRAVVPLPGGCRIGDRPVDLHLKGLAALGADLRLEHGCVVARAKRLVGATIDLAGPRGPTVTGTANVLSAAVLARGTTLIRGAAQEPEIVALGELLNAMGARIGGLGTATLEIQGVSQLGGADMPPDRRSHRGRHGALGRGHHRRRRRGDGHRPGPPSVRACPAGGHRGEDHHRRRSRVAANPTGRRGRWTSRPSPTPACPPTCRPSGRP